MQIDIVNDHDGWQVDESRMQAAIKLILAEAGVTSGAISIAIVDDTTIHRLNAEFLQHDYATDVISFALEQREGYLEGEVVASADTAARAAERLGWPPDDELLLYIVHGTLHLVGYDDLEDAPREVMRHREAEVLAKFGLRSPAES